VPAPSLAAAAALGGRAVLRNAWLLAPGLAVAGARRASAVPALAVAWVLLAKGAALAASRHLLPFLAPRAPLEGALAVATSPRFVALVTGLWLSGAALGAALRVAWLAGALPTLGATLAGIDDRVPRFAPGLAWELPRVLAAAALGGVLDLAGGGFGATLGLAVLSVGTPQQGGGAVVLAAASALALTLAIAVPLALSIVADGAVVRAALRGDGPVRAVAAAGARLLGRPGPLFAGALAFAVTGMAAAAMVRAAGGIATGFALGRPELVLGPRVMIAAAGALVALAIELWWLATLAVLVCAEEGRAGQG
jgi:hypothetical protein